MFDALRGALVALNLAGPAMDGGIVDEAQFQLTSLPEARRVDGCGHELGASEIQVALARAFLRQTQAVTSAMNSARARRT